MIVLVSDLTKGVNKTQQSFLAVWVKLNLLSSSIGLLLLESSSSSSCRGRGILPLLPPTNSCGEILDHLHGYHLAAPSLQILLLLALVFQREGKVRTRERERVGEIVSESDSGQ